MSRIELTDSVMSIVMKMSDGNPGAVSALSEIIKHGPVIDPQSAMPEVMPMLHLDTHGIYGTDIYVLFNDKCHRNVRKLLVLIRATQLGFLPPHKLKQLAADQSREVNLSDEEFADLDAKVCAELSEFQRPSVEV